MRRVLRVVSVILMVIGAVWFFQGINVLPGSFMTGQTRWAVIGGVTAVVGVVLWVTSRRSTR
jgi:type IV secretory pathway VirB6-like protein